MAGMLSQLPLPLLPAGAAEIAPGVGLVTGDDGGGLVSVHGLATFAWDAGDEAGRRRCSWSGCGRSARRRPRRRPGWIRSRCGGGIRRCRGRGRVASGGRSAAGPAEGSAALVAGDDDAGHGPVVPVLPDPVSAGPAEVPGPGHDGDPGHRPGRRSGVHGGRRAVGLTGRRVRITHDMYVGAVAGVLDRARQATA